MSARRRLLNNEEVQLLVAGIDLLIDRGQRRVMSWGPKRGSIERRDLEGRELNVLRDLRADLRVQGVQLP